MRVRFMINIIVSKKTKDRTRKMLEPSTSERASGHGLRNETIRFA